MKAEMYITIDNDECNIKLNGSTDLLVGGICGAIQAIVENLMNEYQPTDFDTEGMTDGEIRDCMTALILTYIMDSFDNLFNTVDMNSITTAIQEAISIKEQHKNELNEDTEEAKETKEHIADNIETLNFDVFGEDEHTDE